jgi:hypothetical protein
MAAPLRAMNRVPEGTASISASSRRGCAAFAFPVDYPLPSSRASTVTTPRRTAPDPTSGREVPGQRSKLLLTSLR